MCMRCAHVVFRCGVIMWFFSVVFPCCVFVSCVHKAFSGSVFMWCVPIHVMCFVSSSMWCVPVHVMCLVGVSMWCVPILVMCFVSVCMWCGYVMCLCCTILKHGACRKVRWEFFEGQKDPWCEQCVECSSKTGKIYRFDVRAWFE